MSFVNAAAAAQVINDFGASLAGLATRAVAAGTRITEVVAAATRASQQIGQVSQNIRGTLFTNVEAANKAITELQERSKKAHEEFMEWVKERDKPIVRQSDKFQTPEWFATQTPEGQRRALEERFWQGPQNANLQPGEWRTAGGTSITSGREGPAWGELWTPEQTLASRGMQGAANLQEANAFADALAAAVKRFEAGFPNSYFTAVVLAMEIPYLRIGARSAAEAKLYIQSFAPFFLPGFQKAVLDPNLSPTIRSLTNEAISILQSGQVSTGGGAGGVGGGITLTPRRQPAPEVFPPGPTTAESAVVAGISGGAEAGLGAGVGVGATALATRADVAALGATITRTAEQQATAVRGIGSTVAAQTREAIVVQTTEANRRLAEQFSSIQGWQQRVETGYLRPVQEGIVRANRELAEQFQQVGRAQTRIETGIRVLGQSTNWAQAFRDELERLNLSGRLGVS